jgi:GTP-binding protein HflX
VRSGLASLSIVGYTNAGKSTLLNRLTDAGVLVEDRLFATLDPTTRRLSLPGGEPVLLTDTVGFVRRLPHGLVEAFKSTLEVVSEADLLVHVVDGSAVDPQGEIDAVRTVLA